MDACESEPLDSCTMEYWACLALQETQGSCKEHSKDFQRRHQAQTNTIVPRLTDWHSQYHWASSHEVSLRSGTDRSICRIKLGTTLQSIPTLRWQDRNDTVQSGFLWNLPQMGLVAVKLFLWSQVCKEELVFKLYNDDSMSTLSKMGELAGKGVHEAKWEETSW